MFKQLCYTVLLLFALMHQAYADSKLYTTVGAGWTLPVKNSTNTSDSSFTHYGPTAAPSGESFFNLPAVTYQNKYKNGYNLNVAIGSQVFDIFRAEIEFLYQRFKRNITGSYGWAEYDAASAVLQDSENGIVMVPTNSYTNLYTVLTNGYYDYHNKTKWTPLIGAGFGIAWIKSKSTSANGGFTTPAITSVTPTLQLSPELSGTAFAWQLKAGVTYEYSKNVAIVMQYRLFATTAFTSEATSITTNPNADPTSKRVFKIGQQFIRGLVTNSLELQFKFNFI